jgi:zinc/manganese transport system permease protein
VADHSLDILLPALLTGILVLATHVPLGRLVLDRGIVFIDLAIAQVAGLGVVIADFFGWEPSGWSVQIAAVIAALVGAGFLIWTERRLATLQEAVIGVVFVVAASAEIVLLSYNPHGADELKDLLVGQILWVVPSDLIPTAILYAIVVGFILFVDLSRWRVLFYALFAVTVTASVQLVGVFLVFASLIIPSLAVRGIRGPRAMIYAYAIGLTGYALGLLSSAFFDLPTGAAVVCALALVAALTGLGRAVAGAPVTVS